MAADDHRAALAAIGAERLAAMTVRADAPAVLRLASHLGLILVLGLVVAGTGGGLQLLAQAGLGVSLVFLFCAAHECIHRTAFRTEWLNDLTAALVGIVIVLPPLWFRYFHLAHHRHTQDPVHDPELASGPPRNRREYLLRLSGWTYWRSTLGSLIHLAAGGALAPYLPQRAEARLRAEARGFLIVYACLAIAGLATGWSALLTYWIVPLVLGQPVLRAYLMAEHTACPMVPDIMTNTRTTFCHRAVRWLAWEMPWHTAHHAAPQVPFHRLAGLSADLAPHLHATADGYADAHRQIRDGLGD